MKRNCKNQGILFSLGIAWLITSAVFLYTGCIMSGISIAREQGLLEDEEEDQGETPPTTNGETGDYSAADYFNTPPGYGIQYHITDTYDDLDATVWAVHQSLADSPSGRNYDFFTTLVADTESSGTFASSALAGYKEHTSSEGTFHWYNSGMRVRNQSNFFRMAMLPTDFSIPESWSYDREEDGLFLYSVKEEGDYEVGGTLYPDCIKIEIQNDTSENEYLKGRGYYIISPGVGIVELLFNRSDFTRVTFQIIDRRTFSEAYTVDGTVEDNAGTPVQGVKVQLAWRDFGLGSTTGSSGTFTAKAFGPNMQLYVGYDNNDDYDLDDNTPDANYPYEPVISNLTGNRTGDVITLP